MLENLTKFFGTLPVLTGLSFQVSWATWCSFSAHRRGAVELCCDAFTGLVSPSYGRVLIGSCLTDDTGSRTEALLGSSSRACELPTSNLPFLQNFLIGPLAEKSPWNVVFSKGAPGALEAAACTTDYSRDRGECVGGQIASGYFGPLSYFLLNRGCPERPALAAKLRSWRPGRTSPTLPCPPTVKANLILCGRIPELIVAIIFVAPVVGFGLLPGMLALSVCSTACLASSTHVSSTPSDREGGPRDVKRSLLRRRSRPHAHCLWNRASVLAQMQ